MQNLIGPITLRTCALLTLFIIQLFGGSQVRLSAQMAEQQRTSEDAQQGIPAIPDPAALDQDQYGKLAQGASVGAGSGAAFGGAVGAAGGPAGAAIGAAVGGLAGAAAGGVVAEQRGPEGGAVSMKGAAENLSGSQAEKTVGANFDTNSPGVTF